MSETANAVTNRVEWDDWQDIAESEFVDFAEGVHVFALVFDHPVLGLHGIRFDKKAGILEAVSFDKRGRDDREPAKQVNRGGCDER